MLRNVLHSTRIEGTFFVRRRGMRGRLMKAEMTEINASLQRSFLNPEISIRKYADLGGSAGRQDKTRRWWIQSSGIEGMNARIKKNQYRKVLSLLRKSKGQVHTRQWKWKRKLNLSYSRNPGKVNPQGFIIREEVLRQVWKSQVTKKSP